MPCTHAECKPFKRCVHICPEGLVQICGQEIEANELAAELMKNADIMKSNGGGITVSGGEPLMQPEFLNELLSRLTCHKAIETSGYGDSKIFETIISKTDYILMDIKMADREKHKEYTGVYNDIILKNFEILRNSGKKYVIRTPLIPNITDTKENLSAIEKIIGNSKWEKLKYNEMAKVKYDDMLDMKSKYVI